MFSEEVVPVLSTCFVLIATQDDEFIAIALGETPLALNLCSILLLKALIANQYDGDMPRRWLKTLACGREHVIFWAINNGPDLRRKNHLRSNCFLLACFTLINRIRKIIAPFYARNGLVAVDWYFFHD